MSDSPYQKATLRQIHLHLTGGGNLNCHHCLFQPTQSRNGNGALFLPLSVGLQAIREAIPAGLRSVRLNGGDSLFHPDLDALLDRLESLELAVQIETNGAGLTPQRANRLSRMPQTTVLISIDGADSATHDMYSGRPGSFDYATRAVRILSATGLPVQVNFTVRRRNAVQIPAMAKLVEDLGGESIRFLLLQPEMVKARPNGKNGNGNGRHYDSAALKDIHITSPDSLQIEELIALSRRVECELAYTTRVRLLFDQPAAFRGLHPKARTDGQVSCCILQSLSVTASGAYTLCGMSHEAPEMVLGYSGKDSLADIWANHPTLKTLREGLPEQLEGVCQRCTLKQTCLGGCVVENKLRTGSFWAPGWFCDAADRVGLFPAGRLIENII